MKRRRRYHFQEDAGEAGRNRRPHASAAKTPTANAIAGKCAEARHPSGSGGHREALLPSVALRLLAQPANEGTL